MLRFILRRLALLPPALIFVHFFGYAYALLGRWFQTTLNPFFAGSRTPPPLLPEYAAYWQGMLKLDFGKMPGGSVETVPAAILRTSAASLGLLAIAFALSLVIGLLLGLSAVRTNPPGVAPWLVPVSSVSLSMPSFYIGAVVLTLAIYYLLFLAPRGAQLPFPLRGFGWDIHLLLPAMVLTLRPAMQIAQITASVLADEMHKQYVVAGRSLGHTWRRVRWRTALKNALTPIILAIGSAFRLLVVELILVEWLFGWPGLGSLLARTLFRPQVASVFSASVSVPAAYLYPPVVAAILAVFAALFLAGEMITSTLVRMIDPRLRALEGDV